MSRGTVETYRVTAYKTTGKVYTDSEISLPMPEGHQSRGELWKRMVDECGGCVPGLTSIAADCEFVIVVDPVEGPDKASSCGTFVVMPTAKREDDSPRFEPHGRIARALCCAAEEFASDPVVWHKRSEQATEILEKYVHGPMREQFARRHPSERAPDGGL